MGRSRSLLLLLTLAFSVSAAAQTPSPALVPRVNASGQPAETGFSTAEQRHVYAPPDEGVIEFPLQVGALPMELAIEEQSMCDGSANVRIEYSKSKNYVKLDAKFKGLPYKPSYCYEWNPTTDFNKFPDCVDEGAWQMWFIVKNFTRDIIFWYDAETLDLLGSEYDFPTRVPTDRAAFQVVIPGVHMIESPLFHPEPDGDGHFQWEFAYDGMVDYEGTAGVLATFVPTNLCFPDEYITYWTNGGMPLDEKLTGDDMLQSVWAGYGINVTTSLEPDPKPEYLRGRDNIMIGHTGNYPQVVPDGYMFDFRGATVVPRTSCETHQNDPWPAYYPDMCSVN